MKNWIQASVANVMTNGKTARMGFLVDAFTVTDTEARITEYFEGKRKEEKENGELDAETQDRITVRTFKVVSTQQKLIEDILGDGSKDHWYSFRLAYYNEMGQEKKVTIVVNANSYHDAYEKAEEWAHKWTVDCQIIEGKTTDIIEVMHYVGPIRKEDNRQTELFGPPIPMPEKNGSGQPPEAKGQTRTVLDIGEGQKAIGQGQKALPEFIEEVAYEDVNPKGGTTPKATKKVHRKAKRRKVQPANASR